MHKLQWDYYNPGYLDKVDQSDHKEITIQSEKVKLSIIITMEWNQQHGWKPANYNLQMSPFEPTEESLCFLRGLLEWMVEPKNVNVSYIFVLRSLVDDKYKIKQIYLLQCLVKHFAFLKNVFHWYLNFVLWVT